MRPRINSFGKINRDELEIYFNENNVHGFTVKINDKTLVYSYYLMFRNLTKQPEMIYVEVSKTSKLVIKAWTEKGIKFNNIEELKKYTKYGK